MKFFYLFILILTILSVFLFIWFKQTSYTIKEIPHFFTDEECDFIIRTATEKGLEKSRLYEANFDDYNDQVRKSEQTWLFDDEHPRIQELSNRIAKLTKLPTSHQEAFQVVHYGVGGKYEPHYDACKDDKKSCERMNGKGGARYLTVLIYLNTVPQGGGTTFPQINRTVIPEKGKVVIFQNVNPKTEEIIIKAEHGGDPVIQGEKWIANKWIHINPL
jgi:prolyl 4-hydroxylase